MPMKFLFVILGFSLFLSACSHTGGVPRTSIPTDTPKPVDLLIMNTMKISSTAFEHNQRIPAKYTCDGEDVSPPLKISGVPENAKSLVLIVDDPDAPRGTYLHWTVWNIGPKTSEILENSAPTGAIEGTTDFGRTGYGGPCPPSGTHRYFFKLYALDAELALSSGAKLEDLEKEMAGHVIMQAELIGAYSR